MAYKTEGQCPIATDIFIRKRAKRLGVSLEKMIEDYAVEADTPKETVRHWVWPRKRTVKNDSKPKMKKLADADGVIQKDEVAGEDMKKDAGPDASDKFRQLWKNILSVSEGLEECSKGLMNPRIYASLEFMCLQAALVGVDLVKIHETFEREKLFNKK